MAATKIDARTYVAQIPLHVSPLGPEAQVPIKHYRRAANDAWNLVIYLERNLDRTNVYRAAADRHMQSLRVMVLLSLIEAFERFLKELAAVCVDNLVDCVDDGRFDAFPVRGGAVAHYVQAGAVGHALCESLVWCDCATTNERFRALLADPWEPGSFYVFPKSSQKPAVLRDNIQLMNAVWQLRHSIVHNRGILTPSDASKLRILLRESDIKPGRLNPRRADVWYVKLFLDELAQLINREVIARAAELLSSIHGAPPHLFSAQRKAESLATAGDVPVTVAGSTATP